MEEVKEGEVVTPGQPLGNTHSLGVGKGAYSMKGRVFASVVGAVKFRSAPSTGSENGHIVEVEVFKSGLMHNVRPPALGDTVTCRVNRLTSRMASVEILCVGDVLLSETFPGSIRARDVRAFNIDSVEMHKCYRPGDIVRAEVLSLGDAHSYFLTTAKNHLGVVFATSSAAYPLIPISWEAMQCVHTKKKEARKVAKPQT